MLVSGRVGLFLSSCSILKVPSPWSQPIPPPPTNHGPSFPQLASTQALQRNVFVERHLFVDLRPCPHWKLLEPTGMEPHYCLDMWISSLVVRLVK